jgi:catechol 2,3-dioxygenase-like lactoylglutathione lyase family enzyme
MTPNVHIHLAVSDIVRSTAFYETLFGPPVKVKAGYRKFLPSFAPLNLAMSETRVGSPIASASHLGIQFPTADAVSVQLARVKSLGLQVREEVGVDCCHANQDKFWVRDPDGVEWEFYAINYDLEDVPAPAASKAGCCGTGSGEAPISCAS